MDPNNVFKCNFCEWQTKRQSSYKVHMKSKHDIQGEKTNKQKPKIKTVNINEMIAEEKQNPNVNNTCVNNKNKFENAIEIAEKDKLYKLKQNVQEVQEKNSNNTFLLDGLAVLLDKWLESRIMQDKIEIEFINCIKNEIKRQQNNTEEINKILDKNSILLSNIWQKIDEQQQIKLIL